jgi:hypothetical protein
MRNGCRPVAIASGESMEGEIDLGAMPIGALTRIASVLGQRMCLMRLSCQLGLSGNSSRLSYACPLPNRDGITLRGRAY